MFKYIEGYKGVYEIDETGAIKSLPRHNFKKERYIKKRLANTGYIMVDLSKEGVTKSYLLHRLKAIAFIPNPLNLPCINHIDGDKLNNDLSNLEWCTSLFNNKHAWDTGLKRKVKKE